MRQPLVSIIVPTLNTPHLTGACLSTVVKNTTIPYELIVVSNSRAWSIRECLKKFKAIRIIQNPKNMGYAKAANQGIRASRGKFLCFLNSDTLVPPSWIGRLLEVARKPGVGAVGPTRRPYGFEWPLWDLATREAITVFIDREVQRRYRGDGAQETLILCGFCLVIPKPVLNRVGLFDERFFFGWEDTDYSLQLRMRGYRLLKVNSLFVHHLVGGSPVRRETRREWTQQAERQFLAKWRSLLNPNLADSKAVLAWINRRLRRSPGNLHPVTS